MDCVQIRLIKERELMGDMPIDTPYKLVDFIREEIQDYTKEVLILVNLTVKLKPINVSIIGVGTERCCMISSAEIFKTALLSNATNIMVLHNHPSGDVTPSKDDIEVTKNIIECGKLLGIPLVEHIILSKDDSYSFFENRKDLWNE